MIIQLWWNSCIFNALFRMNNWCYAQDWKSLLATTLIWVTASPSGRIDISRKMSWVMKPIITNSNYHVIFLARTSGSRSSCLSFGYVQLLFQHLVGILSMVFCIFCPNVTWDMVEQKCSTIDYLVKIWPKSKICGVIFYTFFIRIMTIAAWFYAK